MRTTLDIDDELLTRAKEHAARKRTTLDRLIEEGLALRLELLLHDHDADKSSQDFQAAVADRSRRRSLPVFEGRGGLTPAAGNGLTNRALFDATDDA